MLIIKPRQISGEIMTLIEEADKKVILITPYFKVKNWHKMLNSLNSIKSRKIPCEIYIREKENESIQEVKAAGFEPILIPNLHTKLYINEQICIVSSMNILLSSDTNSLDIALKTENKKEYDEIWDYYLRYIKKSLNSEPLHHQLADWRDVLEKKLCQATGRNAYIKESSNKLQIQTSNKYEASIIKGRSNELRITGILSDNEFDHAVRHRKSIEVKNMRIDYIEGTKGYYNTVEGILGNLKSSTINELVVQESEIIVSTMTEFVLGVEGLKKRMKSGY